MSSNGSGAVEEGEYRLLLWREVASLTGNGTCVFVMLNPSKANATKDDPTMRRVISFAGSWGFRRVEVVNLFAFRSTNPFDLCEAKDAVGPDNDRYIRAAVGRADRVVVAWGGFKRFQQTMFPKRAAAVLELLDGHALHCFGYTLDHQPLHPLYQPSNTALMPYPPPQETT